MFDILPYRDRDGLIIDSIRFERKTVVGSTSNLLYLVPVFIHQQFTSCEKDDGSGMVPGNYEYYG